VGYLLYRISNLYYSQIHNHYNVYYHYRGSNNHNDYRCDFCYYWFYCQIM